MIITRTIEETRQQVWQWKSEGLTIGLCPTMGYLHEGHLSLMQASKRDNDKSGSGIGLEQVAKRLELMYPERYTWEKGIDSNTNNYFSKIVLYNDNKVRHN